MLNIPAVLAWHLVRLWGRCKHNYIHCTASTTTCPGSVSPNCVHSSLENPSYLHSNINHLTHTPAPFHIYTDSFSTGLFFLCVNLFSGVQVRQTRPAQQSPRWLQRQVLLHDSFITWILQTKWNAKFFNQQCCYSSRALSFMYHLYILHIGKNTLSFTETSITDILYFLSVSGRDCTPWKMWKTTIKV